jgi:hypothetical protein
MAAVAFSSPLSVMLAVPIWLVVLLCLATACSASASILLGAADRLVRTGAELAACLHDSQVSRAVLAGSCTLNDEDFAPYALELPLALTRNFTFEGDPDVLPVLSLRAFRKVRGRGCLGRLPVV